MRFTDYELGDRIDGLAYDGFEFVALHMGSATIGGEPPAVYHWVDSGMRETVPPEDGKHWYTRFTRRFTQDGIRRIGPWGFSALSMAAVVPSKSTNKVMLGTLERSFRVKLTPHCLNLVSFDRKKTHDLPGKPGKASCVYVCPSTDLRQIAVGVGKYLRVFEPTFALQPA